MIGGGLKKKMPPKGSGTIKWCDFIGLGGLIYAQATPNVSVHFLFPADQNVGLSAPSPAPCLPAHIHVPP